jgi:putative DNA primase/helicase
LHYWGGASYNPKTEEEVRGHLTAVAKKEFDRLVREELEDWRPGKKDEGGKKTPKPACRKVTTALVANVAQALSSMTLLTDTESQPTWLGPCEGSSYPAAEMLACRNGLVHLPTVLETQTKPQPPTPLFFSANALDYDFDPQAAKPTRWLQFMEEIWPDDETSIRTLQEWFGYCLLPDTSQQKMLMMIGPPRSGRGTACRVLRALVGPGNVAYPSLASLAGNFGFKQNVNR